MWKEFLKTILKLVELAVVLLICYALLVILIAQIVKGLQ